MGSGRKVLKVKLAEKMAEPGFWLLAALVVLCIYMLYLTFGYAFAQYLGVPVRNSRVEDLYESIREDTKNAYNFKIECRVEHDFENEYKADYTQVMIMGCEQKNHNYSFELKNIDASIPDGKYIIYTYNYEEEIYHLVSIIDGIKKETSVQEQPELYQRLLELAENPYQFVEFKLPKDGKWKSYARKFFNRCKIKVFEESEYKDKETGAYQNHYSYNISCKPGIKQLAGTKSDYLAEYEAEEYRRDEGDFYEKIRTSFSYESDQDKLYVNYD